MRAHSRPSGKGQLETARARHIEPQRRQTAWGR